MSGLRDSDGWTNGNTLKITSVSKSLVYGIRFLAESLGYSTSVSFFQRPTQTVIEGRVVNQRDTYTISIVDSLRETNLCTDLHTWYKCRKVIPTGETKTVYNITVETDNSYIADGIVVHNCQDLSVAGKRVGLHGERSGLFFQIVRIIKEMREATNNASPRFAVLENVPGMYSSAGGQDFLEVLNELCKIKDETLSIPMPESGKWSTAGEIVGDGFSIGWRTLDAQFFGVAHPGSPRSPGLASWGGSDAAVVTLSSI